MLRKVIRCALSLLTIGLIILTVQRWAMDYNENGIYFDGETTYDSDALLVYTVITSLSMIITISTAIKWKENRMKSRE
jgi:hypothetical protein